MKYLELPDSDSQLERFFFFPFFFFFTFFFFLFFDRCFLVFSFAAISGLSTHSLYNLVP